MFVFGKTDIGKVREENQDKYRTNFLDDNTIFAVVCDGMGGAASGGLASEITANAIYDRVALSFRKGMEPKSIKSMLESAVAAANALVFQKSTEEPKNNGMGTTCVAAMIHNGLGCIVSVGDSRAYRISDSGIFQITTDHNMAEYLRSKGISEDEEKLSKVKNVITRAVGVDETVELDYFELGVEPGEYILICTDGLTNYLSDELIYTTVYKQPLERSVNSLVDKANALGGKDNITVVLISI